MKSIIRFGVFETNSSATHSLIIMPKEEYEKWKDEQLYYNEDDKKLYTHDEVLSLIKKRIPKKYLEESDDYTDKELRDFEFYTFESWNHDRNLYEDYETYTSPSGDKFVIRCKYGYDW